MLVVHCMLYHLLQELSLGTNLHGSEKLLFDFPT